MGRRAGLPLMACLIVIFLAAARWPVAASRSAAGGPSHSTAESEGPVQPSPTDRASLLADSELRYETSGGIAGFVGGATIGASGGTITVEHRPAKSGHGTPAETGTLSQSEYLELWADVERAGIWSLTTGPPARGGADTIQHELEARIGARTATVRWTEEAVDSGAVTAGRIGRRIVEAARRAVAPVR